jgi:membrane-associated protein
MELIGNFVDILLHLDKHLGSIIQQFGMWTYLILFVVVFLETGFVVTPFLPGDSLLFAAGAFAAIGAFDVGWLMLVLIAAAILGDTANYWIGHYVGPRVFQKEKSRFFKKEYLDRTHAFYEKHGGKTIIIARFVPILRTFAPFVAGIGRMSYGRFIAYNVIGGVGWVVIFVTGGYLFGNIPVVKKNFSLAILAIILVSVIPIVVEFVRHRRRSRMPAA